ncbi:recombinase family protein [Pseudoneobacillus sp. C159]
MSFFPEDIFNCVCYIRKSRQDKRREKETDENTLFEQKMLMKRLLKDVPFPVDEREEIGSGETFEDRPIISKIIDECLEGKFNAIAVKEISRIGRSSMGESEKIRKLLEWKKIYIITPSKVYDPRNESDKSFLDFYFFMANQELKMIKARMVGARYNYAKMGKWMAGSSIPYGYLLDKKSRKLIPHPDEENIVKDIFNWYVDSEMDMGIQAIVGMLNRKKIPSPKDKKWVTVTVKRILSNPVYIGTVIYGKLKYHKNDFGQKSKRFINRNVNLKRIVEVRDENDWAIHVDSHKPLVDKETFKKAQDKLENRKREYPVNTDFEPDVLAGLFTCHECGKKMLKNVSNQTYNRRDGSGEVSHYRKEFLACIPCSRYVKYRRVEEALMKILSTSFVDSQEINQHIEQYMEKKQQRRERLSKDEEIQLLNKEETRVLKMLQSAADSYNAATDDFMKKLQMDSINRYREQLEQIQSKKREILNKEEVEEESIEIPKVQEKIKDLLTFYNSLHHRSQKNELLRSIIDYGEVHIIEKGRGRREAKFELKILPNYDLLFGE